ncbi:electron transport complex protein rnfE [Pseudomonas fluorescens]|uniref:Electron transport complex protein rnfE n=2 Tax=Pseudomonas fluorescens TaxID=294 RepID=A0A448E0K8_PSEFL|nr:electron transport complex protein rnfE [Pseudomonas fluorescens]
MNLSNSLLLVLLSGSTDSMAGALGTLLVLAIVIGTYSLGMRPLRSRLASPSALLASVLLAATLTSCADILAQRWLFAWHQSYGLYGGLIALQCVILEQHGFFRQALAERVRLCALFAGLMLTLAVLRELTGKGHLGAGLTEHGTALVSFGEGVPLAALIPGAFIILGLLLAARQAWTRSNSVIKETHRP